MQKMLRACLGLAVGGVFGLMAASAATASQTDQTTYQLEEVVVHAHPVSQEGLVVEPDVTIINVEKFKKPGRIENITDILGEVIGINVMQSSVTPAQNEGVYIRGMDQSRFQVFMDGRPMRLHGSNGYFKMDWTTMPLTNVETIEVIRGSHSLLFPFAQGGCINIITKKGVKTGDPTPHGSVKFGVGPYGDQNSSANLNGGIGNVFGYAISAGHREGDGYLRGNDYNTDNVSGRFSLFLPNNGTLTYGIDHTDTVTGYAVINDPDDPASDYDPSYPIVRAGDVDTFSHDYEGTAYAGGKNQWERTVTDQSLLIDQPLSVGKIRGQVYQQRSERYRYRHNASGVDQSNFKNEYTGGISLNYLGFDLIPQHALSVGGDYRNQGTYDNTDYYRIATVFIQDVWDLTSSASLTFGTRWYEFKSDSYTAVTLEEDTHVEREWCPKARLNYNYDDTLELYASASREMRLP